MNPHDLWVFLPVGYLFSISIETPVLVFGLSDRHSMKVRIFSGFWLTACTYPIVILVMPLAIDMLLPKETDPVLVRAVYLAIAETFAPVAECTLFWLAFGSKEEWGKRSMWRDLITITLANLASFGAGEFFYWMGWWDFLFPGGP